MNDDRGLTATWHRLTEVRDSLGDEHMTIPASEIIARDKRRRARHWLTVTGAACAAIGVAVAVTLASGSPARTRPERRHTQLATWTVHTNPDGTVTFTLQSLSNPAKLQRALAKAGVPAVIRWKEICEAGGPGQPLLGNEAAFMVNNSPLGAGVGAYFSTLGWPAGNSGLDWSWTVIPSKMPHGGHFVISAMPGQVPAGDLQAVWEFAKTSAPIGCAKFVKPTQQLVP
jgi:hypothetical protein